MGSNTTHCASLTSQLNVLGLESRSKTPVTSPQQDSLAWQPSACANGRYVVFTLCRPWRCEYSNYLAYGFGRGNLKLSDGKVIWVPCARPTGSGFLTEVNIMTQTNQGCVPSFLASEKTLTPTSPSWSRPRRSTQKCSEAGRVTREISHSLSNGWRLLLYPPLNWANVRSRIEAQPNQIVTLPPDDRGDCD